jgi:hypothetical protein
VVLAFVEDDTEDRSSGLLDIFFGSEGDLFAGLAGFDYHHHSVYFVTDHLGLGKAGKRRAVQNDVVKLRSHGFEKLPKALRLKKTERP